MEVVAVTNPHIHTPSTFNPLLHLFQASVGGDGKCAAPRFGFYVTGDRWRPRDTQNPFWVSSPATRCWPDRRAWQRDARDDDEAG